MTPAIDSIKSHLAALLLTTSKGLLITRDEEQTIAQIAGVNPESVSLWGMNLEGKFIAQTMIKFGTKGTRLVISCDDQCFFETPMRSRQLASETERALLELDWEESLREAFSGEAEQIIQVYKILGISIVPKFNAHLDNHVLNYARNEVEALKEPA
jgi:hypothetical protein